MLNRRTALATVPALLAGSALAKAPLAPAQAPAFYRYKVGDFEVTAIGDGVANRMVAGFVKNVPEAEVRAALGEIFLNPDSFPVGFTSSVVNTGSKLIVVDTGNGDFALPTSGLWWANFKAAGFNAADVDTVIHSHFHPDHINGTRGKDAAQVAFPNAEIMVPAPEWAYWMDDAKMAAAPDGFKPNFNNCRRVFGPVAGNITRYEWGKEITPGITAVAAPGHTPGHTAYVVSSGGKTLMLMSDTTNLPHLFARHPDWHIMFDMDPGQAVETRKKLLDMASQEKARVAFYHATFPSNGYIVKEGAGYVFVPQQWAPV